VTETKEPDWPVSWPEWVLVTLREFEAAENLQTVWSFDNAPKWVERMQVELALVICPKITKPSAQESGPRFLARMIGHQERLASRFELIAKMMDEASPHLEKLWKMLDQAMLRQGKSAYAKWQEWNRQLEADVDRFCEQFLAVCERKTAIIDSVYDRVSGASLDEQAEYHSGLGESLGMELIDENGALLHATSTTSVYFCMMAYWRGVQKMRSVSALHIWLCRCLGRGITGDLDRVKKICQRYGIHFRRPGRPRKEKGQRR